MPSSSFQLGDGVLRGVGNGQAWIAAASAAAYVSTRATRATWREMRRDTDQRPDPMPSARPGAKPTLSRGLFSYKGGSFGGMEGRHLAGIVDVPGMVATTDGDRFPEGIQQGAAYQREVDTGLGDDTGKDGSKH